MNLDSKVILVLPEDVLIIPVTELDPAVRRQFEHESSEYAVERLLSRMPAKIIDHVSAMVLEQFRIPKTIADAIIDYSNTESEEPEQVLQDIYPLLQHFADVELLVPANSASAKTVAPSYEIGKKLLGLRITRCMYILEDTEIYEVQDQSGQNLVLKCTRERVDTSVHTAFHREETILTHLHGSCSPVLHKAGTYKTRSYLIMEHCAGVSASIAASRFVDRRNDEARSKILNLCCDILTAYSHLHEKSVVHADIHASNVLVGDDGAVHIIDFGLARLQTSSGNGNNEEPPRGGVPFYTEPELALAYLTGKPPLPATQLSDQYALGVLIYHLLTGRHYLDFSIQGDTLFPQIAEDAVLPFAYYDIPRWPQVEQILTKALSKEPQARYSSVAEFERALREVQKEAQTSLHTLSRYNQHKQVELDEGERFLQTLKQRLGSSGRLIGGGLQSPPRCSVNVGGAGIAYMFYRLACLQNNPHLLYTGHRWINLVKQTIAAPGAFDDAQFDISTSTVGSISPFHTLSGVHTVDALLCNALGDISGIQTAMHAFIAASKAECNNLDLTLGRSSTLIGCSLLIEALAANNRFKLEGLISLGDSILDDLWSNIDRYGPVGEAPEIPYLGLAHGWAGILYATLRWAYSSGTPLPSSFSARLLQLIEQGKNSRSETRWPLVRSDDPIGDESWPGWCHGSAGYVFLFTLAYQVLKDESFLALATRAAEHLWTHPTETNSNLCCGLAGQAYALLNLYKYTRETDWVQRARTLADKAVRGALSPSLRRNSLYRGDIGVGLLVADLGEPFSSAMPFFEQEGWPVRTDVRAL